MTDLDALKRINDADQRQLDRAAAYARQRSERGPAPGFDRSGMPPPAVLAELETQSRRRFSPRKALWPEVARFDEHVAELEQRQRIAQADVESLAAQLVGVDARDADAYSRWELSGRNGESPERERPALEERLADAKLQAAGLDHAIGAVLAEKAAYVEKHRGRLTKIAERLVSETRTRVEEAIDVLATARAELAIAREAALWAELYPAEETARMPAFHVIGGGSAEPHRILNATEVLPFQKVIEALKVDAAHVVTRVSDEQRQVLVELGHRPAEPGAAVWASDPAVQRSEREQAIAAFRAKYGEDPPEEGLAALNMERFGS